MLDTDRQIWMYTTFIELIVDGNVVDLNRIPLPADTQIIDERFRTVPQAGEKQVPNPGGATTPKADKAPAAPASVR